MQKLCGCLFKRNKISNEDTLRRKSQWELSHDVLRMPIASVLVELFPFKICHTWLNLMTTNFLYSKI